MSQSQLREVDEFEPALKDVFESSRGSTYQIFYVDDQVVLLRDEQKKQTGGNYHRMETRKDFEMMIEEGQMVFQPESDLDLSGTTVTDWSQVDLIGAKTAENLHDRGFTGPIEVQMADDAELLSIPGLGQKGLKNLRAFTQ